MKHFLKVLAFALAILVPIFGSATALARGGYHYVPTYHPMPIYHNYGYHHSSSGSGGSWFHHKDKPEFQGHTKLSADQMDKILTEMKGNEQVFAGVDNGTIVKGLLLMPLVPAGFTDGVPFSVNLFSYDFPTNHLTQIGSLNKCTTTSRYDDDGNTRLTLTGKLKLTRAECKALGSDCKNNTKVTIDMPVKCPKWAVNEKVLPAHFSGTVVTNLRPLWK